MDAKQLQHGRIELVLGNIVDQTTDAIVNAANSGLGGGSGVDGAIHAAAGPELLELCLALPEDAFGERCPTGEVRVTAGCELPARYVLHGVGPVYGEYSPEEAGALLRKVHQSALEAALELGCRSVAFPAISTGVYGYPIEDAARIALGTVRSFLDSTPGISLVRFVLFSEPQYEVFEEALREGS